jgi:hypothetical protein
MSMAGDFDTQKSMMLERLRKMKNCVEASNSSAGSSLHKVITLHTKYT